MKTIYNGALVAVAIGIVLASLRWKCFRDPGINFLPRDSRAEWIVFPAAPDARLHLVAAMDATFRRAFTLETQPKSARLQVRTATHADLKINGKPVEYGPAHTWKDASSVDVLGFLHTGPNTIEARVFNNHAPPALWLLLKSDQLTLASNQAWEASFAGSSWKPAVLASTRKKPGPGNLLAGSESTLNVLPKVWPRWAIFGIIALFLLAAARWWNSRTLENSADGDPLCRWQVVALLGAIATLWIILFWNNALNLPFHAGYDSQDHLAYVEYVQERCALPLPNEGFEMFQPPLYYVLSAAVLSVCRLSIADARAVTVLRGLTVFFGIANFSLVFLTLRLLFPTRTGAHVIGLLLAAFLPMQLYLSHYVTNETLAATLMTATIYFGLRGLKDESGSVAQYSLAGVCLGAAMLVKATGLLLVPPLLGATAIRLVRRRVQAWNLLRTLGMMFIGWIAVCGWHYFRIWRHFGTPILGNWEPATGFHWWQEPGFHTALDYFRFGQSLIHPLFSGFNGLADGIYSTLWGDALCGGLSDILSRTPWNYDLMIGGYLLALAPTLLVVVGAVLAIYRFIRTPSAEWFLLLGLAGAVTIGIIFMTLKVPSYAQVKAFYGLSAVVPLCAFAAVGWEKFVDSRKTLRFAVTALVILWAINSFASFWIPNSASQSIYAGLRLLSEQKTVQAMSKARQALSYDPPSSTAYCFLALTLSEAGDFSEALQQAEKGVDLDPTNSDCHLQLATAFMKRGETEQAIEEGHQALALGPENSRAYEVLFASLRQSQRTTEAIAVARDALAVSPFDSELHYRLGLAAGETGDLATAARQFAYALLLRPDRIEPKEKLHLVLHLITNGPNASTQLGEIASSAPDAPALLDEVAWTYATHLDDALRNGEEAVQLAQRACQLTDGKDPRLLGTLAAAQAETARFSSAVKTAQKALSIAQATGDRDTVDWVKTLLSSFRANRPYRQAIAE